MDEVFPTLFVFGVGLIVLGLAARGLDRRRELPWLVFAFLAHVVAAFGQVWLTRVYYGYGDPIGYHRRGSLIADLVVSDPRRFLPEVITLLFQGEPHLPFALPSVGPGTASQTAVAALVAIPCLSSYVAMTMAYSLFGFVGARALYQVFRERFPARLHPRLLLACMAVPSAVFWTSGILKESIATPALGFMVLGLHLASRRRWIRGVVLMVPSLIAAALIKGYVVATFCVGAGIFLYWTQALGRRSLRIRPAYLLAFGLLAVLGLLALGRFFPRYAIEGILEETSRLRATGTHIEGGSNYELGSWDGSIGSQVLLAPLALATALFRPFPFEVRGAPGLVNGLEMGAFLAWLAYVAIRTRWTDAYHVVRGSPILVFSVVFVVLFGVGVGLATTNLGTLSRYRAPMVPFLVSLVVVIQGLAPSFAEARRRANAVPIRPTRTTRRPAPLDAGADGSSPSPRTR